MTLQRISELVLARYNTVRLLTRGALEIALGHYWLLLCGSGDAISGQFALAECFRHFAGSSRLGECVTRFKLDHANYCLAGRTTRVHGRLRFMSHPNYVVVACEKSPGTGDRGLSDAGQAGKGPATRGKRGVHPPAYCYDIPREAAFKLPVF